MLAATGSLLTECSHRKISSPNGTFSPTLVRSAKSILEQEADVRLVDDGHATNPTTTAEGMQQIMDNFENKASVVETVKDAVRDAGKALKAKL